MPRYSKFNGVKKSAVVLTFVLESFVRLREARERPRSVAWQHDASAMISLNPPESFSHIFGSSGAARSDRTGAERLRRY